MDQELKDALDQELIQKTENWEFLEDPINKDISDKYVKHEAEKGLNNIITKSKEDSLGLEDYLSKNLQIFTGKSFLADLNFSKRIYGDLYLHLSKGYLIGFGGRLPSIGAIPEAIIHTEMMEKGMEGLAGTFSGIESYLASAVKEIMTISGKEGLTIGEVIEQRSDQVFKEICNKNPCLSYFGPWMEKSFLKAVYEIHRVKSQLMPYTELDYEDDHEAPKNKSGFHIDKDGTRYVLLNVAIKDEDKYSYERLFFNLDNYLQFIETSKGFMDKKDDADFQRLIRDYNNEEKHRILKK